MRFIKSLQLQKLRHFISSWWQPPAVCLIIILLFKFFTLAPLALEQKDLLLSVLLFSVYFLLFLCLLSCLFFLFNKRWKEAFGSFLLFASNASLTYYFFIRYIVDCFINVFRNYFSSL